MLLSTLLALGLTVSTLCGTASWYHEGHTTANGESYKPDGITAAHRTLPFGTRVKVTNKKTGKSVVVRINDRGPAKWTRRDIDLSRGAFRKIAKLKRGVVPVCIEIVNE